MFLAGDNPAAKTATKATTGTTTPAKPLPNPGPPIYATYRAPVPAPPKPVAPPAAKGPRPLVASTAPAKPVPPVLTPTKGLRPPVVKTEPAPPPFTPVPVATSTIVGAAATYKPSAPPVTVVTPAIRAVDQAIATQQKKADTSTTTATTAQGALDLNAQQQKGIDGQEALFDKPIQMAGAEKRRTALVAQQPALTTARDATAADRAHQKKTLAVMTTAGDAIRYDAQAKQDAVVAKGATARSDADFKAFSATAPTSGLKPGDVLGADARGKLTTSQRQAYDRYVLSQATGNRASAAQRAHEVHATAAQFQQQVDADDPAAVAAVADARHQLNHALAPLGQHVNLPVSIDARLPGKANATLRDEVKGRIATLATKAADLATTADAAWDLDDSVVKSRAPDMVSARDAAAVSNDGAPAASAAVDRDVAVKQSYLQTRLDETAETTMHSTLDSAKAALGAFDARGGAFTDPARTTLVGDVATAQQTFDLAQSSTLSSQKDFVAAIGSQQAALHPTDQGVIGAVSALQADARVQSSRVAVDQLTMDASALRRDLAANPAAPTRAGALDPRVTQLQAIGSRLGDATAARDDAGRAAVGTTLRNDFLQGLSPELRDATTDAAKTDFAEAQYAFFRDEPAALAGLDATTQDQLKQDPSVGKGNAVGSTLEMLSGAALFAIGTAADLTGVGAVLGVAAQVGGANLFLHGLSDLATNRRTDGFLAQGLEAAGVARSTSQRVDTGVNLALGVAGGGASLVGGGLAATRLALEAPTLLNATRAVTNVAGLGLMVDQTQAGVRQSVFGDTSATAWSTSAVADSLHLGREDAQNLVTALSFGAPLLAGRGATAASTPGRPTPVRVAEPVAIVKPTIVKPAAIKTNAAPLPSNVRALHPDGAPEVPPDPIGDAPLAQVVSFPRKAGGDEPEPPATASPVSEPQVLKLAAGGEDLSIVKPATSRPLRSVALPESPQAIRLPSVPPRVQQAVGNARQATSNAAGQVKTWTTTKATTVRTATTTAVQTTKAAATSTARSAGRQIAQTYWSAKAWGQHAATYVWKGNTGTGGLKSVLETQFGTPAKNAQDFLGMPKRFADRFPPFLKLGLGYTKTVGKVTGIANAAGLVAGAGYYFGPREQRTSGAVTSINARDELRKLQTDPDRYLRDNYDNGFAGSGIDVGYNIDGHLRAMAPTPDSHHGTDATYYSRRVPSDLFDALKQQQAATGNTSDQVFVNENILDANGQRKTVSVEIRPPYRDEPFRDSFIARPSPDGGRLQLNFGVGPLEGLRPHLDLDLDFGDRFNTPGQGQGASGTNPVSTLRWQFRTLDQPTGIDLRQQTTTIFSRVAFSTNVLDFNSAHAIDLSNPQSITSGKEYTVGNLRGYLDIGNRNREQVGTDFTKTLARARETGFLEVGGGEDFFRLGYNKSDYASLNAYHEFQYYTPDFRLEGSYVNGKGAGLNPKVVQDLVPKANIDTALQLSSTGLPGLPLIPSLNAPSVSNRLPGQDERALAPTDALPPASTPSRPPDTHVPVVLPVYVTVDGRHRATRTLWGIAQTKSVADRQRFVEALAQIYAYNPRFDASRQDGVITTRPPGDPDLLYDGDLIRVG